MGDYMDPNYIYGPVSVYAIKSTMWGNSNPGSPSYDMSRGWTWGIPGQQPNAGLTTGGTFQVEQSIYAGGKIGIGTTAPDSRLHITDGTNYPSSMIVESNHPNKSYGIKSVVYNGNSSTIRAYSVFNTDISQDVYRVMGDGVVWCTELNVDVAGDFPDYVFSPTYNLMPIEAVESYIATEGHLPNMPSAEEVEQDGIAVSEMMVKQVEKIEELTLYIIDLNTVLTELQKENAKLKVRLDNLESDN